VGPRSECGVFAPGGEFVPGQRARRTPAPAAAIGAAQHGRGRPDPRDPPEGRTNPDQEPHRSRWASPGPRSANFCRRIFAGRHPRPRSEETEGQKTGDGRDNFGDAVSAVELAQGGPSGRHRETDGGAPGQGARPPGRVAATPNPPTGGTETGCPPAPGRPLAARSRKALKDPLSQRPEDLPDLADRPSRPPRNHTRHQRLRPPGHGEAGAGLPPRPVAASSSEDSAVPPPPRSSLLSPGRQRSRTCCLDVNGWPTSRARFAGERGSSLRWNRKARGQSRSDVVQVLPALAS